MGLDLEAAVDFACFSPRVGKCMTAFRRRKNDFDSPLEMKLTAVGMVPEAREVLEAEMDRRWNLESGNVKSRWPEIIIGGGLHASIYAAVRVKMGYARPLIIEKGRLGGGFAMTKRASWWTNSSNRPGASGLPGENRGLNHIPGAPIQADKLSSLRFVPNTDMGFCIRTSIAAHGTVKRGNVVSIEASGLTSAPYMVMFDNMSYLFAGRVLDARGWGRHRSENLCDGKQVMTSVQFMQRMDTDFPLRDLGRVAIIGNGKSALCVAEGLLGLGPSSHMSVAGLDWVEQVDLYAPDLQQTCEKWKETERTRYATLAGFLQAPANGRKRLRVFNTVGRLSTGFGMSYVNERPYETVILANGWERPELQGLTGAEFAPFGQYPVIASKLPDAEVYKIGVCAELPFSEAEKNMRTVIATDENRVAAFRLGGYTATLAAQLPDIGEV